MAGYIVRRLLLVGIVLGAVSLLVFLIIFALPGSVAHLILGPLGRRATGDRRATRQHGLDDRRTGVVQANRDEVADRRQIGSESRPMAQASGKYGDTFAAFGVDAVRAPMFDDNAAGKKRQRDVGLEQIAPMGIPAQHMQVH